MNVALTVTAAALAVCVPTLQLLANWRIWSKARRYKFRAFLTEVLGIPTVAAMFAVYAVLFMVWPVLDAVGVLK